MCHDHFKRTCCSELFLGPDYAYRYLILFTLFIYRSCGNRLNIDYLNHCDKYRTRVSLVPNVT